MRHLLKAFLPPIVTILILSCVWILPKQSELLESRLKPDMPLGHSLPGWKGVKTQESERERQILAADTRFSKARYIQLPRVPWEKQAPAVDVSIVYSGQDMNNSIHRPERCLPSQGHLDVRGRESEITLADGSVVKFTRLSSRVPMPEQKGTRIHFIHYYLFVGNKSIHHSHMARNLQDILDRIVIGQVQQWAYFQAGTCWGPEINVTEEDADRRLRKLISELLPGLINWESIK